MNKRKNKTPMTPFRKGLLAFLVYFLLADMFMIGAAFYAISVFSKGLPSTELLERIPEEQSLSTVIYSSDGVELNSFQREKRFWVTYDEFPTSLVDAVLSTEDQRFHRHWGVSIPDLFRAVFVNLRAIKFKVSGKFPYVLDLTIKQGFSTITMQLAKNLYFGSEKTLSRKFKEILTAIQIEKTYSKEEILEMYLNKMELGNNRHGIQAAAKLYFNKDTWELNIPESALLAGLLQNWTIYNPRSQRESLRKAAYRRRNLVLRIMARAGKIPWWIVHEEVVKPIELAISGSSGFGKAPYFVDHVRRQLVEEYGEDFVYTEGAKVHTTLDYRLQKVAEDSLKSYLDVIQRSFPYQRHYERPDSVSHHDAVLDSLSLTAVQGALVAIEVQTGKILAMVGGRDFSQTNWFNRATDAKRGAGSSFKPFVYTAALDNGWRCSDTITDTYWSVKLYDGTVYEPSNFLGDFLGIPLSLRDGMKTSRNMIAIKLMNDYENGGIGPKLVKKYARAFGLTTYIPEVPSMAIGTAEVKLLEMVSAYTVFPKHGIKTERMAIQRIVDKNNTQVFQQNEGRTEEVLNPEVASLMLTMMQSVAREGTGRINIPRFGMGGIPCAGKTGTGSEYKDAWFIGYTPHIACGVWVGFDSEETTLEKPYDTGSSAAIPIWAKFMKQATEIMGYPHDEFKLAGNLTTAPICRESYKRATATCPPANVYDEFYISGTELQEFCKKHQPSRQNRRTPGTRKQRMR